MAGSTYTPIQTQTVTGVSSITFNSIPSTYTDLVLVGSGSSNSSGTLYMQFNSVTSSQYSYTSLYGNGSTTGSGKTGSATPYGYFAFYATNQNNFIANIQNYSNNSTYKTTISQSNSTDYTASTVMLWANTVAINSVLIAPNSGTFTGTLTLYGIQAA
jgi:hypothetical protein